MKAINGIVAIAAMAVLSACQSNSGNELAKSVETENKANPEAEKAVAEPADIIEKPVIFPVGTKIISKFQGNRKNGEYVKTVISTTDMVNNRPGITYATERGKFFVTREGNFVQNWNKKGELVTTRTPPRSYLRFPLRPGDSWTINWLNENHLRKWRRRFSAGVKVVGWEQVSTGLGKLRTVKVLATGTGAYKFTRTLWYSPQYGVVKADFSSQRTGQKNTVMRVVLPSGAAD